MSKYLLFALLVISFYHTAHTQNAADVLRYSWLDPTGTARHLGAGSALGPLGADFSVISTNPAGLAWMRRSEFTISPGLNITGAESVLTTDPAQPVSQDVRTRFNLPNVGIVVHTDSRSMETFNFGIGLTRVADFTERISYDGTSTGSIVQRFTELANSFGPDEFEASQAISALMLLEDDGTFFSDYTGFENVPLNRSTEINRRGGISEINFGFAGNVNNRILWGFSVGAPLLNFREERIYRESDDANGVPAFERLEIRDQLTAVGTGLNAKLGLIVRPHQAVRIGVSVHTPTVYQIDETFSTERDYSYEENGQIFPGEADTEGGFNYNIRTPWRLSGGVGAIINKKGFLTAEVEYVDYTSNEFQFEGFPADERLANQEIADSLSSSVRLKLGGEIALDDYRIRAGYGIQDTPIASSEDRVHDISLGFGYRKSSYSIDLGYRRSVLSRQLVPYATSLFPVQLAESEVVRNTLILTFGFRW